MRSHFLSLMLMVAGFSRADTLTLRNGQCTDGTWLGGDANQIKFAAGGGQIKIFPRSDVSEVTFGADAVCALAPPPPSVPASGTVAPNESVRVGDTVEQVEAKLGRPSESFGPLPGNKLIYTYKNLSLKITFKDGKVTDTQ